MKRFFASMILFTAGLVHAEGVRATKFGADLSTREGLFVLTSVMTTVLPPGLASATEEAVPQLRWSPPKARPALEYASSRFESLSAASVISAAGSDDGCAIVEQRLACWGRPAGGSASPVSVAQINQVNRDVFDVVVATNYVSPSQPTRWIACVSDPESLRCAGSELGEGWKTVHSGPIEDATANPERICVVSEKRASCARSVDGFGEWRQLSASSDVVDIAMSGGTLCVAEAFQLRCDESGVGGDGSELRVVSGPTFFEKIWLLDSGFQGIRRLCAYARSLLWCDSMSRKTNGLTYELYPYMRTDAPKTVLTASNIDEGLRQETRQALFTNIVVVNDDGVALVLEPSGGPFGVSRGGIPISVVVGQARGTSTRIVGAGGSTNSLAFLPLSYVPGIRGQESLRQVTLTSQGRPLVGARVRWMTSDSYDLADRNPNQSYRSDENGNLVLRLPAGPISLTVSEARLTETAYLEASVVTIDVDERDKLRIDFPPPPPVQEIDIEVTLPDGSPVPNAVVSLKNPFVSYGYSSAKGISAAWSNRGIDDDADLWFYPLECVWCVATDPPWFMTGVDGKLRLRRYQVDSKPTAVDATVFYDDGEVAQSVPLILDGADINVRLSLMAKLDLIEKDVDALTEDVDVNANGNGEATFRVEVDEWLADAEPGETIIEPVCDLMEEGGSLRADVDLAEICTSAVNPSVSVRSFGADQLATSRANKSFACPGQKANRLRVRGRTTLKVCTEESRRMRVRINGALPTKIICVRVNRQPCKASALNVESPPVPNVLKRSSSLATSSLIASVASKKEVRQAVATASGSCRVVKGSVRAQRRKGLCQILIWQTKAKARLIGRVNLPVR